MKITKKLVLSVLITFTTLASFSQTYYYNGTGNITSVTSWGTNTNGTGTNPGNFTTGGRTFEIRNTTSVSLPAAWTVSGFASKVVLGNSSVAAITFTVPSAFAFSGTIDITSASSGSNTLVLQNTTIPSFGTVAAGSTVQYDGTSAQIVGIETYYNLVISNTGIKSFNMNMFISGGGTLTINDEATLNAGGYQLIRNGGTGNANIIINGKYITTDVDGFSGSFATAISSSSTSITLGSSSTIEYAGTAAQAISLRSDYANVTISGGAVSKTIATGATILSGNMNVNAGTLVIAGNTLTISENLTGTGAVSFTTGTLNLAGNYSNTGTLTLGTTSTINYTGTSAQSVRSTTYSNLGFSNAGVKTFAGPIMLTAGRTMLINANAIVNAGTNQITSTGATVTITINGTLQTADLDGLSGALNTTISNSNINISAFATTSTIVYNAPSGNQMVTVFAPDSVYANLVLSGGGTKTTAANFYILSGCTFTLDAGIFFDMGTRNIRRSGAGTATFNINGIFYTRLLAGFSGGSTAINSTGTVINLGSTSVIYYGRTTEQTLSSRSDYAKVRIDGNSTKTLSGPVTISDSLNIINGDLVIGTNTLTLNGPVGGAGTLTGSATSNISIGGSAANATLNFTQTSSASRSLNNLILNRTNGATISNALEISGTVTVTNGTLASGGNITLLSTASGTARIAALAGGASVSGNVTIQRFIPGGTGKRRYRYLTSPVNTAGSYNLNSFIDDIYITGNGAGYDANTVSPSVYIYNEAMSGAQGVGFVPPATTSTPIPVGAGISVFVRGSRGLANQFNASTIPDNVTIDMTGTINSGTISAPVTYTNTGVAINDGWNMVANPYPSQIDWNAAGWTKTNIINTVYIYNAVTGTYGAYNGIVGTNNTTSIIPSGQAFFVKATAANPVLTFTENVKTSANPFNLWRTSSADSNLVRITFYKDSVNADEALVFLSSYASSMYDMFDAEKLRNNSMNIYTKSSDLRELAINCTSLPVSTDTIALAAISSLNTPYQLRFNDFALEAGTELFLKDNYLNTMTLVTAEFVYYFSTTADAASNNDSRFKLIFVKTSAPLPIKMISFTAKKEDDHVTLNWNTLEENTSYYTIEKSNNATDFELLTEVTAKNNSHTINSYSEKDNHLENGITYYRLTSYDINQSKSFSKIISIDLKNSEEIEMIVYPNPATEFISIHTTYQEDHSAQLSIIDVMGRVIESEQVTNINDYSKNIQYLKQGIYYIQVVDGTGLKKV
jgi:trimeric autotransporter adhesin